MIVNCVAYQNGRRLTNIPVSEIRSYISHKDCFVWMALNDATPDELQTMQNEFDLHDLAVEDAQHGHQRPKIDEYEASLFVVLQIIERAGDELTVGEVAIFVGANYVLSVRTGAERGFTDVRARCEREPELLNHGAGYVLYALMDAVVDRYFPILDELETEIENIEDRMFADQTARANIEALYDLKAQAHDPQACHRTVARSHQQTIRRPRAAVGGGTARLFPRCLRSCAARASIRRHSARHDHYRYLGGDLADHDSRK